MSPGFRWLDPIRTDDPRDLMAAEGVLKGRSAIGGIVEYGESAETSAFVLTDNPRRPGESTWPLVIYPSGRVEVVFQHLATRPPFDEVELREGLRMQLNQMDGVGIPPTK